MREKEKKKITGKVIELEKKKGKKTSPISSKLYTNNKKKRSKK